MIAKLTTGNGFSGCVRYDGKIGTAEDLACFIDANGVSFDYDLNGNLVIDPKQVAWDFRQQVMGYTGDGTIRKPVYHWSLSYSPKDNLTEAQMLEDAHTFLKRMGFDDTQYLIAAHYDKEHKHLHVIANIVDNQGKRIPTMGLIDKAHQVAAAITKERGYVWGEKANKETIDKAHKPQEKVRMLLKPIVQEALAKSASLDDLKKQLQAKGVSCEIKIAEDGKRGGISFGYKYDGQLHTFRGSSLDRQLSFGYVNKAIHDNAKQAQAETFKINRELKNEYWQNYNEKYRPQYLQLKESCDKSFSLYKDARDNYGICSEAIKEKYNELRSVYSQMNALQEEVQKASTAKGIVTALSALVFCMNPVAGIALGLVGRTIAEAEKSASIEARRSLRSQAAVIRDSISELKTHQAVLRQDKTDKLKVYVENKEAKAALQTEISNLKAILDKKLEEPRTLKGFAERYAKHVAEQQPSAPRPSSSLSSSLAKYNRKGEILQVFKSASDENSLRLGLASHGLSMQEVSSRRGVEDITITAGGENSFTVNVSTFGQEFLHSVLEQYAAATKKKPAYKTEMELQRVQRIRPTQAINQDVARQIQQEKAREQAQKASQAVKNTVSQVNNTASEVRKGGVKIR